MSHEGLQLGRYRLLRLLGSGGMGEVYLATDTLINRQVAIKVIRAAIPSYPDASAIQEAARLFQREMKAISHLDHPHILSLFDYGEETVNGTPLTYLVMPYRPEGSLAMWLQQRGSAGLLSPEEVAHFVGQAADALQHAHDQQIIHQDVKLANFLIRSNKKTPSRPDLLLADFGVAKFSSATATASQSIRGTPAYMAPEQWDGHPELATDQYALAIMAYDLLTGRPPFQGSPGQVMRQHFMAQPQPPSTLNPRISPALDAVILQALAKNSADRFPSITAFAQAFQAVVQDTDASSGTLARTIPSGADIRATLAISRTEALTGTSRTLNLPGGRRVTIAVPAEAYDGQVIYLRGQGDTPSGGGPTGSLILTIAIHQAEEPFPSIGSVEPTLSASSPNLQKTPVPTSTPDLQNQGMPAFTPSATQYTAQNQGIPTFTPISTQYTVSRGLFSKGGRVLLIGLALLVVASSIGIFSIIHTNNTNQIVAANARATANAYAIATARVFDNNARATANVYATATARVFDNPTAMTNTCPNGVSQMRGCQTPHSLRVAYGVESLVEHGFTGKGQTIVDIVSFGSPTLQQDLDIFDKEFGLPPIKIQVISPLNEKEYDPHGDKSNWANSITQDVEIFHAIAPDAGIVVLTSPVAQTEGTTGLPEFRQLIQYAIDHHLGNIISNSWGASEVTLKDQTGQQEVQKWDTMLRNATTQQGITFFASTSVNGATDYMDLQGKTLSPTPTIDFMSDSPWVTAVGGTTLLSKGQSAQEKAWSSSGGGFSAFYPIPSYQQTLPVSLQSLLQNHRGVPDVSADADSSTGMAEYFKGSWEQAGGTAASTALWAALGAIANQVAGHPLGFINPGLYKVAMSSAYTQAFHDITVGNNDVNSNGVTVKGYSAVPGWDAVAGWGSPNAEVLLPALTAALKQ